MTITAQNNYKQEELKQRLHVAKLSLFNARLMSRLSEEKQGSCTGLVTEVWLANGHTGQPVMINQAMFFQMGYVSFVWLWESVKEAGFDKSVCKAIEEKFNISSVKKVNGTREINSIRVLLTAIRNALGHGNVGVFDDYFEFFDENRRSKPPDNCTFQIGWPGFGQLAELLIFAVGDQLYARESSAATIPFKR